MSQNDIITQVHQSDEMAILQPNDQEYDDYNTQIKMNMRGTIFTITRDDLMALPESILLCLFPNGVFVDMEGNVINNLTEDDLVYVNFAPECFTYICNEFDKAVKDLTINEDQQQEYYNINDPNILNDKPSIIVLREDLDYYCIPPVTGLTGDQMRGIKLLVGQQLVQNQKIFDGLGYQPGKQLKPAEQHLLDMLCSSGFQVSGDWGHRSLEPGKTVVFSLALVRLSCGTSSESQTPEDSPVLKPVTSTASSAATSTTTVEKRRSRLSTLAHAVSRSQSKHRKEKNSTATKLLLFWRKPARKCWWSDITVKVDLSSLGLKDSNGVLLEVVPIKVHIRRVWTLELSVIGVQ